MKKKIAIDVPSLEQLLAGLEPRALHAPFAKAERVVVDAEQLVERRRRELAVAERTAVELPARVNRGEAASSVLVDKLRDRDVAELLLKQANVMLADARAQLTAEDVNAKAAVVLEIDRRSGPIKRTSDDLAQAVDEVEMLERGLQLARERAQRAVGMAQLAAQEAQRVARTESK